jgi:hypothetical protein
VAQKVLTTLQDDIDGTKASETIIFSLDGASYEIDLNAKHANKLRKTFAPFVNAGRRVGGRSTRRLPGSALVGTGATKTKPTKAGGGRTKVVPRQTPTPVDPTAVRVWAAANRIKVSPRGRISAAVIEQFRAAGH